MNKESKNRIPPKPQNATWTDEQWSAIYEDHKNIIVSAGAGSGKTAVLTERVIRKLKDQVAINELLILTFTKAAAQEMKDRIRNKIKKIPELKEQLNLLDSAYITTFDSFALSIVKKYHYLLNVSNQLGMIESSVIEMKKDEVMDELFLEYYQKKDPLFLKMIESFCVKDDKELRKNILKISNQLDLLSNKKEYLKTYLEKNFNPDHLEKMIEKYQNLIIKKIELIKEKVEEIRILDQEFATKLEESLSILYQKNTYDELTIRLNIKLPMAPRGSEEELKTKKKEIADLLKELKKLTIYENQEVIKQSLEKTKPTITIIIELILKFDQIIMQYKRKINAYEFHDIAIMAIKIVKENKDVQEELKKEFKEIMIDEYQDTNDLQEEFIQLISNHNVYMVGDIKQSIYRFRNANPYIFKAKYDQYSNSTTDLKIDLNKNFRSRKEVLNNINTIFNLIMNDEIGGANYLESHQMIFGNQAYLKESTNISNDMEIYQYEYQKELGFTKEEIEIFLMAKDIITKYQNKTQVFDKDTGELRDIKYGDFAIIIDRSTSFELYKKIFNYFQIPLTILKDEKLNEEDDIHVISNLIRLIIKIKERSYDTEVKYLFTSIMRSFLYQASDEEIFDYFQNNNIKESPLYQKCFNLSKHLDYETPHQLIDQIITEFHYYEQYLTFGNIYNGITKITKIRELAINLEQIGYNIQTFSDHLKKLLETGYIMEYQTPDSGMDSVRIMTIHKSKGLEYPICYFGGLYKEFNISDLKEKFLFEKEFGIIVPYFEEGISTTISKDLLKEKYLIEEISEKIRLFYVALTRAREKIILLRPKTESAFPQNRVAVLNNQLKSTYRSLLDILDSIEFQISLYQKDIPVEQLNITKDYTTIQKNNYQNSIHEQEDSLIVKELNIKEQEEKTESFSKKSHSFITKKQYQSMQLGTKIHEYLEFIDFKNPNLSFIQETQMKTMIQNFLQQPLLKEINQATIYQEYEFIYQEDHTEYHGIIDLMLEYESHIDIIDYKLKHTSDKEYQNQLKGYKKYIQNNTSKPVNIYLYSLLNHTVTPVD